MIEIAADSRGPDGPPASLRWAALGFFATVLAGLHVVVDPAGFDVSLVPRLLALLGFLVPLTLAVGAGSRMAGAGVRLDAGPLREPLVLAAAAYVLVVWASLSWAFNPTAGLADAFTSLAMLAVLCLTCLLLPGLPRWRETLPAIAGCGALAVVCVGVAELVAARAAVPAGTLVPDRAFLEAHVTGNQSNVNLCANLLVLLLPWCCCGLRGSTGIRRGLAAAGGAAALAMIVVLQSRSALLGLAAGATTALVTTLTAAERLGLSRGRRRGLIAAALAAVALAAGFIAWAPDSVGLARRLRSIAVDPPATPGTAFRDGGRREMWGLTCRMIGDRPLTGVGAGNFGIAVQSHYDERIDLSRMHHNWANPHNDFLGVFAEKGLGGIAAFVAWLAAAALAARHVIVASGDRRDAWVAVWMLALLAAYATMSCFDFPLERVSQPVVLAASCGALAVMAHRARPHAASHVAEPPVGMRWLAPAAVALTVLLVAGCWWAAAAVIQERRVAAVYRALRAGDWERMLAAARAADWPGRTIDAHLTPVAYHEGHALLKLGRSAEAIASLERSLDHNPNRLPTLTNLGILYAQAGRFAEAEICLREVVRRYPQYPPGYVNLAGCLTDAGRPGEAVTLLEAIPEDMRTPEIVQSLEHARAVAAAPSAD